ncbi:transposase [Rhodococcus sp. A14]|uniref:transposase n=1 Tax=Rhodococcus sp. A14 TaxID=1194106 RepID=UPI003217F335
MHRFTDPAHLCSWAGLTPKHRESFRRRAPRAHQQAGQQSGALGGGRGHPTASRGHDDRRRPHPASRPVAARTSPRSPRRENCSPSSTTGCATGTSAH